MDIILKHKLKALEDHNNKTIYLCKVSELKDKDTHNHLERVSFIVREIIIALKSHEKFSDYITSHYIKDIVISSTLHDVGERSILLKNGKLNESEFEIMKQHTTIGYNILKEAETSLQVKVIYKLAVELVLHHHEKWDGTGYPSALKGEQIPLSVRIMAIADVYDALISNRPYKKSLTHEEAISIIEQEIGKSFDP